MLELLTGAGLAVSAGVNAYIPLLVIGLGARLFDFVALPESWKWLENPWVLVILGVLLIVDIVADKIPAVDSVNDWIQTVVRPTSGGIAFGSGSVATTRLVTDPAKFFTTNAWVPIALGVVLALAVHIGKTASRPVLNAATAGFAAPVASVVEDVASFLTSLSAILLPVVVIVALLALALLAFLLIRALRRRSRKRREGRSVRTDPLEEL